MSLIFFLEIFMKRTLFYLRKKLILLLCIGALFCSMLSCGSIERSALELMREFTEDYGWEGVIYSPSVREGEAGYADEAFFESVWGEGVEYVSDFAVVFSSSLDKSGECAVFICYNDFDAARVSEMIYRRFDLIASLGIVLDTSSLNDSFVLRRGRVVVASALPDNDRAKSVWKRII